MGSSSHLRQRDIVGVFQLVHECREMWADADAWQRHLLGGACRLTGMAVGTYTESHLSADRKSTDIFEEADLGWRDNAARARHRRLFDDHTDRIAYMPRVYRLAGRALDGGDGTMTRPEMRDDTEWYSSAMYNEYFRPAFLDGFVISFAVNQQSGNLLTLGVCQDITDRAPTRRARSVMSLLSAQLAPLVGTALATRAQRGTRGLSPRLRDTLDAVLAGDSEKQIAARLGLGRPTVHEYVGALYRHFDVSSRGELMAYFLRRRPEPVPVQ